MIYSEAFDALPAAVKTLSVRAAVECAVRPGADSDLRSPVAGRPSSDVGFCATPSEIFPSSFSPLLIELADPSHSVVERDMVTTSSVGSNRIRRALVVLAGVRCRGPVDRESPCRLRSRPSCRASIQRQARGYRHDAWQHGREHRPGEHPEKLNPLWNPVRIVRCDQGRQANFSVSAVAFVSRWTHSASVSRAACRGSRCMARRTLFTTMCPTRMK